MTYGTDFSYAAVAASGFSRDGYTLSAWSTKTDGTGTNYTPEDSGGAWDSTDELILYALWAKNQTQSVTIRADSKGDTVSAALLPTLEGATNVTLQEKTDNTFANNVSGGFVNDSSVPENNTKYGSANANSKVYARISGDGARLEFNNAAAYTSTTNRYFTLSVVCDGATYYINVTLEPMNDRRLDVTVPIVNGAIIDASTGSTVTYNSGLTMSSSTKAPLTAALTNIAAIKDKYSAELPIKPVTTAWADTTQDVASFGVGFAVVDSQKTPLQSYTPGGSNSSFATLKAQTSFEYEIAIYHPKLALANDTFGFNFTYTFAISEHDVA